MGRRRSLLGSFLREMEKSANRSASDARRRARRQEAIHSRALERELVRSEREKDRLRVREERAAERQRIANERQLGAERKQEAKEAQLAEWRMEYEEHVEREADIDGIATEAPEVEDRDRFYGELAEPRPYVPEPFVEPVPPSIDDKIAQLRQIAADKLTSVSATFEPRLLPFRIIQACGAVVALGGLILWLSMEGPDLHLPQSLIAIGITVPLLAQFLASRHADQQRTAFVQKSEVEIEGEVRSRIDTVRREMEAAATAALQKARERYEAETATARTQHEQEETERLQELHKLVRGDIAEMRERLESVLPLELPVPCRARADVTSSSVVNLELEMPEASVLPATEARLLASGKVSYKDKSPKKLNEQFVRLGVGLAFRHACEVMLNLPTCQAVNVDVFRTTLDPSLGQAVRRKVLHVPFDFPTLAPMTMEGLDPVAALKHFEHKINADGSNGLLPLDE